MASKQALQVGIRIGATDEASGVVNGMVGNINSSMGGLMKGLLAEGIAYKIKSGLSAASDEFGEQQYAFSKLRILEMNKVGAVNERVFGEEQKFITGLSGTYAKTTEDYTKMVTVLRQNRISPEDILGGVGESNAKLAKAFDNLDPDRAALFFARLKNDMRVSAGDMDQLANTAYKMFNLGVGGGDANKGVEEITEFFSKASLGAVNLGLTGKEAAKEMTLLGSVFLNKGLSGTSVGTNFRRIFDGLTDPKRMGKVAARGLEMGVKLSFFDGQGKFKGLKNFEEQLDKLKGKAPQQINYVLQPFSGKQGLSIDFLEYLSQWGAGDIEQLRKRTEEMGNLDDAVKELIGTQKIQNDKTESARKNMMAAFGKPMAGDVMRLNKLLQETYNGLGDIAKEHPDFTKVTEEFAAGLGSVLAIYGGLKTIGIYMPVLKGLAEGLSGAFVSAASSLFIVSKFLGYGAPAADKLQEDNPNSRQAKMSAGFKKIIEDPETGFFKRNFARIFRAGIGIDNELFGDHSEGSKYNTPQENARLQYERMNPHSSKGQFNYAGTPKGSEMLYDNNINYNPVINMAPEGMGLLKKADIESILKNNSDALMLAIEKAQARQRNLTYGQP